VTMNRRDAVDDARKSLEILEAFFDGVESGRLFAARSGESFARLRKRVNRALHQLLVWERPVLEASKGLPWPYERLRAAGPAIEEAARSAGSAAVRNEAERFLALLPFPGQWERLRRLERASPPQPEVRDFFSGEASHLAEKLAQKETGHFRLRHFLQVLKAPGGPDEKGVLRVFSLPYILTDEEMLKALSARFFFFVEPPMGLVFRHAWWRAFTGLQDPCLFGVAGEEDAAFLSTQANALTTPLAHGDFLEPGPDPHPEPVKDERYDIVFNATFDDMARKRHGLMLHALHHPGLRRMTALFLGRGQNENVERFRRRVVDEGLQERVHVRANLKRHDVPPLLAACRIGVHLSLYENSCRAVYECFRADLPCVVSSVTAGMNFRVFTSETGVIARDAELPEAIAGALEARPRFRPRKWFLQHSGSRVSSRRLNKRFQEIFRDLGYAWREDIVPLGSSGASRYVDERHLEAFRPEFQWILELLRSSKKLPVRLSVR